MLFMIYCTELVCKVSAAETLVICGNFNGHAGKSYEGINSRCGCDLRSIDRDAYLHLLLLTILLLVTHISTKRITLHKKWSFPLRIWSHLLKKSLLENFIFCAVFSMVLFRFQSNLLSKHSRMVVIVAYTMRMNK